MRFGHVGKQAANQGTKLWIQSGNSGLLKLLHFLNDVLINRYPPFINSLVTKEQLSPQNCLHLTPEYRQTLRVNGLLVILPQPPPPECSWISSGLSLPDRIFWKFDFRIGCRFISVQVERCHWHFQGR